MGVIIGIRREDKNEWERRVPLVPADLQELSQNPNLDFTIQPSAIRVFTDDEYRQAGIRVDESLDDADIVMVLLGSSAGREDGRRSTPLLPAGVAQEDLVQ